MSSTHHSASLRAEPVDDDAELLAATTDCIKLSDEVEASVSATIEALQHLLKRIAGPKDTIETPHDWPAEGDPTCKSATQYLARFSYGLQPGEARYIIYRFLSSNNMMIPKTLEDLTRSAEFRRKQNLDKMALFPSLISMSGFDQATMCEELGIPFIHNLTSGKRYVDAEGRLRLEQDQMDYYNVHYEDIYANLTGGADHGAAATPPSSPLVDRGPAALQDTARMNGKRSGPHGEEAHEDGGLRHDSSFDSMNSTDGDVRRRDDSGTPAPPENTTGGWRAFIPFHLLGHGREKSNPSGTHARTSSSGEKQRGSRLHVTLPTSDGVHANNGSHSGEDDVNDDDQTAASQGAVLLNPGATGEALTGNPYTVFSDSLNFHGILHPIIHVITKHVPFAFHYWDREGHPIMYCRLGDLHSKRLMRDLFALTPIDAEPRALAMLFNTYALAVLWQLIRYCNRKNQQSNQIHDALLTQVQRSDRGASASRQATGLFRVKPPVGSCVVVVDCAGLHLRNYLYKPLLLMVKSIVRLNVRHYPELLHHAYITNCGAAMSFSYLMVRSLLSEETRQKVTFCSRHNSASTLLEHISSDLLPEELGGKCQCPGGCIPTIAAELPGANTNGLSRSHVDTMSSCTSRHSESSTEQVGDHFDAAGGLNLQRLHCTVERLDLGPHASQSLSFAMEAHTEIIWEFVVKKKQKVSFSAIFISAGDDGAMLSLVPRRRVRNDAGHYICSSLGTVIFRWSNKRSYFRRCRVNLKVYREEQTVASFQN